jgi:hypothetical protein
MGERIARQGRAGNGVQQCKSRASGSSTALVRICMAIASELTK